MRNNEMSVTAALVKELREKSGAGMMDCKKALGETGGDMDAALDWLRAKGLAAAAKKSGRVAAEGLVGISVAGTTGAVVPYMHNATADGLGRIGVLVALESTADEAAVIPLGNQIAMHIAATSPASLSVEDLDAVSVARERDVLIEQAKASGKPQEIAEKMVEGRMKKYYQEVVLLEQTSVIDGETRIADVIAKAGKDAGADIALKAFVRFNLGEGVEREDSDFAAEVAAQLS